MWKTVDTYTEFAQVYDMFMDNVPYEAWRDYLTDILKQNGIEDGLVLELGCGTGSMTRLLSEAGYDMIGVDNAEEMLMIAREESAGREDILYLLQDMREFELYGTVRAVISVCDSMNYILEDTDLRQVFSLVNNYLDPNGLFLFDLNTRYKYETLLAENTISENREEGSFIWENYFDKDTDINEYNLTLFIREESSAGQEALYRKYEETHYQKVYDVDKIQTLLSEAGMKFERVFDVETGEEPTAESERICIAARECGKSTEK